MKNYLVFVIAFVLIAIVMALSLSAIALVSLKQEEIITSASTGIFNADCSYPWNFGGPRRCVDKKFNVVCYEIAGTSISCLQIEKEYAQ